MNKRGLSDVVTAVLIILMVIAAVVVVWLAVQRGVLSKLDKTGTECISLDIRAINCNNVDGNFSETVSGVTTYTMKYNTTNILVKRGTDDVNLQNVTILVETADGESTTVVPTLLKAIGAGESRIIRLTDLTGKPSKVSVGGIVMYSSGKTGTCEPVSPKVECN